MTGLDLCRWPYRALVAGLVGLTAAVPAPFAAAAEREAFRMSPANEAAALSIVAKARSEAGEFALAAELFRQAFRTDAKLPGYLYSAARCAQHGGLWARAIEDYQRFQAFAPFGDPLLAKAAEYLQEARAALARETEAARLAAQVRAAPAPALVSPAARELPAAPAPAIPAPRPIAGPLAVLSTSQREPASPLAWRRPAGYSALATGLVGLGVGGYCLLRGRNEVAALQADLAKTDAHGDIVGVARPEALARQDTARGHQAIGGTLLGVGVAMAAVGGYLAFTQPTSHVTLAPTGVQVAWRF